MPGGEEDAQGAFPWHRYHCHTGLGAQKGSPGPAQPEPAECRAHGWLRMEVLLAMSWSIQELLLFSLFPDELSPTPQLQLSSGSTSQQLIYGRRSPLAATVQSWGTGEVTRTPGVVLGGMWDPLGLLWATRAFPILLPSLLACILKLCWPLFWQKHLQGWHLGN